MVHHERRIERLETRKRGGKCAECEAWASRYRFLRADWTPFDPKDSDKCPKCGRAVEHRGKVIIGVDPLDI